MAHELLLTLKRRMLDKVSGPVVIVASAHNDAEATLLLHAAVWLPPCVVRSIIQAAVDERYCSIYFECTQTAKELAHTGAAQSRGHAMRLPGCQCRSHASCSAMMAAAPPAYSMSQHFQLQANCKQTHI
jgi:hypothetical protein